MFERLKQVFSAKKGENEELSFDPALEEPVIKASICTGEQEAGFRDKKTGEFRAVCLIRNGEEKEAFCRRCGADPEKLRTIY